MKKYKIPARVVLYGGTGQAKLVRPIIESYGSKIIAVIDDTPNLKSPIPGVPIFLGYEKFLTWFKKKKEKAGFLITIGNPNAQVRLRLHKQLSEDGLIPFTLVSKKADIADNVRIGLGTQILNRAYIAVDASVGTQCIINAGAHVDHETILEDGVELGPGTIVCGCIRIGNNSWIGAGSVVRDHIQIGSHVIVGAGSVVVKDIPDNHVVGGIPAKNLILKM